MVHKSCCSCLWTPAKTLPHTRRWWCTLTPFWPRSDQKVRALLLWSVALEPSCLELLKCLSAKYSFFFGFNSGMFVTVNKKWGPKIHNELFWMWYKSGEVAASVCLHACVCTCMCTYIFVYTHIENAHAVFRSYNCVQVSMGCDSAFHWWSCLRCVQFSALETPFLQSQSRICESQSSRETWEEEWAEARAAA